jgi:hypothetical protein
MRVVSLSTVAGRTASRRAWRLEGWLVVSDVWLRVQVAWWSWRVRRLSRGRSCPVAVVIHAFQESVEEAQQQHLELWFGYPTDGVPDDVDGPVCRCGAGLTVLKSDRSAFAVYHLREFRGGE